MTYAELLSAVAAWINDPQVEPSIPTFIELAQAAINRRLGEAGVAGATVRASLPLAAEYVTLPADLARPLSLTLANGKAVTCISRDSLEALRHAGVPPPAAPACFAVVGGQARLLPAPNQAYGAELVYQARPAALSASNTTNWILAGHPDVYLYGALLQSAPFLGDDGRAATWGQLYGAALDSLIAAETDKSGSAATPAFRPNMPQRQGYC